MATKIKLPSLGEGVDEADVLDVLVAEGDVIELEQGILEIETDKASAEIPATKAGRVAKVHVAAGDSIRTGDVLLTIDDADEEESDKEQSEEEESEADEEKADTEGKGDEQDETDEDEPRAASEERSSQTKKKRKSGSSNGSSKGGAKSQAADEGPEPSKPSNEATAIDDRSDPDHSPIAASPAVRRYAREVEVDLDEVQGTGSGGRITRQDVRASITQHETTKPPASQDDDSDPSRLGEPDSDAFGEVRVERLTKLQQTMSRRMVESWTTIPRVTNFDDVDMTELEKLRQASKEDYAAAGVKLTVLPLIAKAVALTLKHHPMLNAVIDVKKDEVRFKQYVNLGIAIDSERGLVVPVLRQADLLSVAEVARRIEQLARSAEANELKRDDFYGSTFTISNLGSIGGTYSTPIINPPEVAILLLGRARRMRVFVKPDVEEPRLMLPLSLSYDHRLIDGATAARFLNELKTYIASPTRLLMAP